MNNELTQLRSLKFFNNLFEKTISANIESICELNTPIDDYFFSNYVLDYYKFITVLVGFFNERYIDDQLLTGFKVELKNKNETIAEILKLLNAIFNNEDINSPGASLSIKNYLKFVKKNF